MTNPMTPTEQDKELLDKLEEVVGYLCCDFTPENANEYSYSQKCKWCGNIRANQAHRLKGELVQLITADRKRVALEARLDELTNFMSTLVTTHGDIPARSVSTAKIRQRIAVLKAQQEGLGDS